MVSTPSAPDEAELRAQHTEFERNADFWYERQRELSRRHRGKWILIYDGDTLCVFDGPAEMFAALEALPDWQRQTAYHHFVRDKPMLPLAASFLPRRQR
ncbi:MAG: hypothetical protein OXI41_09115 [Chloroflexota bacterium]|nr:hypothetical protein [Chloroflexota bacterium]MDE2896596.1 hypothetical protein [Chloroflexota bacterium]